MGVQHHDLLPGRVRRLGRHGATPARPAQAGAGWQRDVQRRLPDRQLRSRDGSPDAVLRRVRRHRRRGHRPRLRDAGGDGGKVVPRPQGHGHRHHGDGLRRWRVSLEQVACAGTRGADPTRPDDGFLLARHHLRVHPDPSQPNHVQSAVRLRSNEIRRREGTGFGATRTRTDTFREDVPDIAGIRRHVDRVLLQHRRGHLGHQFSVAAVAGRLGSGRSIAGTGSARGIRRYADCRYFAMQRRRASVLGTCCRTVSAAYAYSGYFWAARWSSSAS